MTHTPAPWTHKKYNVNNRYDCRDEVIGADGYVVCCNTPFYPTGISRDNACLIAAAPDLLALVKLVHGSLGGGLTVTFTEDDAKQFAAAIAKAKGGDA